MEGEDGSKDTPRKDQYTDSSDDEDLPLRKKFKPYIVSDEDSTQGETSTGQCTEETILTVVSGNTAETITKTDDQQDYCMVSSVSDDNSSDSPATRQNTPQLQADINDSVRGNTNTHSAVNLESTTKPETRYVLPQNLLYRPSVSDYIRKHNTSDSVNETDNKHDKPKLSKDRSTHVEQIRQDFIRSWDRILAADDLIPETELRTLNASTPDKICEYLNNLAATNASNENLRDLIPRVCGELNKLQQNDARGDEFHSFEPEPQPIPIGDFLTDPLDSLEPDHEQSIAGQEFEFDSDHWYRMQQAITLPEELPEFSQLFTKIEVVLPNWSEDDNVDYQPLTDTPTELAHIYNTIVREPVGNQLDQSTPERAQSEAPRLSNIVTSESNPIQLNYDANLFRSLLGIISPFEQNENTCNEEITTTVNNNSNQNYTLNRPVETERVSTEILSSFEVADDFNIPKLGSASVDFETTLAELETNPNETLTNPSEIRTNPAEIKTTPVDFQTNPVETTPTETESNPCQMETNPTAFEMNSSEVNTSSVELESNSIVFDSSSNQEDSDTSTSAAEFDTYDGVGEFVIVPSRNNFKPLKILVLSASETVDENSAHIVSTEESTVPQITNDEEEIIGVQRENDHPIDEEEIIGVQRANDHPIDGEEIMGVQRQHDHPIDEEEIIDVQRANDHLIDDMEHFESELNTIETEIGVIVEEAVRFEQLAARFEETAGEFQSVHGFFRHISEIFEFAAMSLQEAVENFELMPIEESAEYLNNLDPLAEGIAIEDDDGPDQEVPDIDPNNNLSSN